MGSSQIGGTRDPKGRIWWGLIGVLDSQDSMGTVLGNHHINIAVSQDTPV